MIQTVPSQYAEHPILVLIPYLAGNDPDGGSASFRSFHRVLIPYLAGNDPDIINLFK